MQVKTGVDIVHIPTFSKQVNSAEQLPLKNLFTDKELSHSQSDTSRAGMFALKEAVMKALALPPGSWLSIIIEHDSSGKPIVLLADEQLNVSYDVSIAHHGEYAIATATFLYE